MSPLPLFGRTGHPTAVWNPTNISGCVLWLRSDLGITMDGSNRVSVWPDQSGVGHDAVQSTDAKKPVWTDNVKNGHPVLTFDGADDWMSLSGWTHAASDYTFFFVHHGALRSSRWFMDIPAGRLIIVPASRGAGWGAYYTDTEFWQGDGRLGVVGEYYYTTYRFESPSNVDWFRNGVEQESNLSYTKRAIGGNIILGAHSNMGSNFFCGNMLEVAVFNSALSPGNMALLNAYASTRYAI